MQALAIDLHARARSTLARLAAVAALVLQPPSVRRALANPATLWDSAHADLTMRQQENAKTEAWRTMVLMYVHMAFALTTVAFLASAPIEPVLQMVWGSESAWLLLSLVALRFELLSPFGARGRRCVRVGLHRPTHGAAHVRGRASGRDTQ